MSMRVEVPSISSRIVPLLHAAMGKALLKEDIDADLGVRRSERADYQANGIFTLAKSLQANPRKLAEQVANCVSTNGLLSSCKVSGNGFLNLTVFDDAIIKTVAARLDAPALGVASNQAGITTVVDYSQPNIAKEMHVGHLRSTIIGDALVRIFKFLGAPVIRQNHLGDWGTQFGMLIQYMKESRVGARRRASDDESDPMPLIQLNELYRAARETFDSDPDFADRARQRVVALQSGDLVTLDRWREIVSESKSYFNEIYRRLGVLLTDADAVGESFYNPYLSDIVRELEERKIAVESGGALCVFNQDVRGPDGPTPLIVRKKDGGFGYATTDLAAIRYRVRELGARRILYVVDARQALHFKMVFETAKKAGWLPENVTAVHVMHGTILGADGKPFKTRAGSSVRLLELLDQAVEKARRTILEKNPDLEPGDLEELAGQVGIGAVKYAELATGRRKDYTFDVNRMVSLMGNTGVYLQYAHVRSRSILRKLSPPAVEQARPQIGVPLEPAERKLGLLLDDFASTLVDVANSLEPHRLCNYLYELAQAFTEFYQSCPVLHTQ